MNEPLLISYFALWAVVGGLALLMVGTLRELGRLRLLVGPDLPMDQDSGVELDQKFEPPWLPRLNNQPHLVLFVSPDCGICQNVLRGLGAVLVPRGYERVFVVCQSSEAAANSYLDGFGLSRVSRVSDVDGMLSREIGVREIPFAVLLDGDNVARRTAIVNSVAQVEAMLEARPHAA